MTEPSAGAAVTAADERFVEAVRRASRKMTIHNAEDTACWYTLRDWLKEQDALRAVVEWASGDGEGQAVSEEMDAADYVAQVDGKKASKYGAIPTEVDGVTFASKAEARRYKQLKLMVRAGEIADLELQPEFPLIVNGAKVGAYVGDFAYTDTRTGQRKIEDVKGVRTPVFRLKKKLVKAIHGIDITEVAA